MSNVIDLGSCEMREKHIFYFKLHFFMDKLWRLNVHLFEDGGSTDELFSIKIY